jgi:hypothetical protein
MELTAEQQIEYDVMHKAFVAQGGPNAGKLKAAGHKDPDGVACLVALGWVNPEAVELEIETEEVDTDLKCSDCHIYGTECDNTNPADPACDNFTPAPPVQVDTELEEAEKDLEAAKATEEDAASKVKDAEDIVKSKTPPPCPRCNGDGFWHSLKTGYRAKTSSEPLIDTARVCPKCK